MVSVGSSRGCLLLLCMTAAALALVDAGDYRNGYKPPTRTAAELYMNYEEPLPMLKHHKIPKHFDWCGREDEGGEDMCVVSWNQHIPKYCGACWAHGSLSMIQDRLKIRKKGRGVDIMLARQSLLNCAAFDGFGGGCDGGDVIDVFHYMSKYGLPDESCMLYSATDHTKFAGAKSCPAIGTCANCMPVNGTDTCWAVETPLLYTLKSYGKLRAGEDVMKDEIFRNGPITCGIACPEDFVYKYRGGVWHDDMKDTEIDHDVEVVGWGEEDGVKFWKVRNSWGTFWGEQGFFRVERGVDALQIESGDCWVAEPDYKMERELDDGKLQGSMYGVVEAPAGHKHKHKHCSHWGKLAKIAKSVVAATRGFLTQA